VTRNYEQHGAVLAWLGGTVSRLRKQQDGNDGAHHVRPSAKNHKPGSEVGRGDGDRRCEVTVNAGRRWSGGERGDQRAHLHTKAIRSRLRIGGDGEKRKKKGLPGLTEAKRRQR